MINVKGKEHSCPIEVSMNLIAGKWKLLIMWHLLKKTRRFGELQKKITNVTQKMLTQQLRELEADGLIHREVYPIVPPKVEYSLTPFGRSFEPVLNMMIVWGYEYAKRFGEVSYDLSADIEPEYREVVAEKLKDNAQKTSPNETEQEKVTTSI
ncbi:winged helix-turn-helix transcriptional regulator [Deferribacteres bacterium DY0037]